jgi:hypothetical protein
MPGTTCLAHRSFSACGNTVCEARRRTHPLDLVTGWRVAAGNHPVIVTLHPRARAQVGSGLGLKRPERRRRRWRLSFCCWINEESRPLGMRQAISQPPSKPGHPRKHGRRETTDSHSMGMCRGGHKVVPRPVQGVRPRARLRRPCCGGARRAAFPAASPCHGPCRACRVLACPWRGPVPA